jgi:hypothetical protein
MADNVQTQNMDSADSQVSNSGNISTDVYVLTQNNCDLTKEAKEDMTHEELAAETKILEHPINWTDPIVWHDPTIDTGVIVKLISKDLDDDNSVDNQQTGHHIDAVYFPLIKVNQRILANDEIIYMRLESLEILPKLHLRVLDKNGEMLKKIGSRAREDMEAFFGIKVYLNLWVKIKENWRDSDFALNNFGYNKKEIDG